MAVWTGAENLAVTGIRSSDSPVRSQREILKCIIIKIALKILRHFSGVSII